MKYTFTKKNVMENHEVFLFTEKLFVDLPNAGNCLNTGYCSPEDGLGIDIICEIFP